MITDCLVFRPTHCHLFSDWVLLSLQYLKLSISESKFAFTRVASEIKFEDLTALMQTLLAIEAIRRAGLSQSRSAPQVQ
jgi:hypothetical protein